MRVFDAEVCGGTCVLGFMIEKKAIKPMPPTPARGCPGTPRSPGTCVRCRPGGCRTHRRRGKRSSLRPSVSPLRWSRASTWYWFGSIAGEFFPEHVDVALEEFADSSARPDWMAGQMGAKQGGNLVGPAGHRKRPARRSTGMPSGGRRHVRANALTARPTGCQRGSAGGHRPGTATAAPRCPWQLLSWANADCEAANCGLSAFTQVPSSSISNGAHAHSAAVEPVIGKRSQSRRWRSVVRHRSRSRHLRVFTRAESAALRRLFVTRWLPRQPPAGPICETHAGEPRRRRCRAQAMRRSGA